MGGEKGGAMDPRNGSSKGGGSKGGGFEGWGVRRVGGSKGGGFEGGPEISRFFSLSRRKIRSFLPSLGSSRGILVVFEAPGRSNVRGGTGKKKREILGGPGKGGSGGT